MSDIEHLIAAYEKRAADADAQADSLVAKAQSWGWNADITEKVQELRHRSTVSRGLAQEVRDDLTG